MDWKRLVITEVTGANLVHTESGRRNVIRCRAHYGISFCMTPGAKIVYEHNGKEYVSDAEHAIFHPKGQSYRLSDLSEGDFPVINFECDPGFVCDSFEVFPVTGSAYYARSFARLQNLIVLPQPEHRFERIGLVYEILSRLCAGQDGMEEKTLLSPALACLEENFADRTLTVETLAAQAHISVTYFRRLFRQTYGMSPKQYIINARMSRARDLLSGSYYSVAAIAADCGFGSESHFSRLFREYNGCSPSEYRSRSEQLL